MIGAACGVYRRGKCVLFRKTDERHGGLSNMAGGFPLVVNGVRIRSSEALYQACRFPHLPAVQEEIIQQNSPMVAKMVSRGHREESRPDWEKIKVRIMRWCLRVKLAQHWSDFGKLLARSAPSGACPGVLAPRPADPAAAVLAQARRRP